MLRRPKWRFESWDFLIRLNRLKPKSKGCQSILVTESPLRWITLSRCSRLTIYAEIGIMSRMNMLLDMLLRILPAEKPVGQGFSIAQHVLWVLCIIAFYFCLNQYAGHSILAEVIVWAGLTGLGFSIWYPQKTLFSTELVNDYRSFLPHCAKHCYRDLTQFIALLRDHISRLRCLFVSSPGNPPRPCVSCEDAAHDSLRLQHLILATTHVLRAPPRLV